MVGVNNILMSTVVGRILFRNVHFAYISDEVDLEAAVNASASQMVNSYENTCKHLIRRCVFLLVGVRPLESLQGLLDSGGNVHLGSWDHPPPDFFFLFLLIQRSIRRIKFGLQG